MIQKINKSVFINNKVILILISYVLVTEIMKVSAEVYVVEQSLELKLLLLSTVVAFLYDIPFKTIVLILIGLLFLSIFNIPVGIMIYILIIYIFIKLIRTVRRSQEL